MRTAATTVLLAFLVLPQDRAQPVPRFRSGVDVILLDVTVLDERRRPARGLTPADFTILEDGKPQPLVSFDEIDSPEPDGSLVEWMREVPPDVRTNYGDDRRLVVIVLDDANVSFKQREHVKTIGRSLVEQLGPADRAAVVYTGNNAKSQEFTNNRKLLRDAVERFADTATAGLGVQYVVSTIDRAVESLQAIPHRRKAMVLVTTAGINMAGTGDIPFQVRQALRRAQRANVTIYPVNPAGLEVDIDSEEGLRDLVAETARMFAAHTGGFAVVNRNEFTPQIRQIFRETGSYYLIGFQSAHRDGKSRRLEVKVNRPGLTARTRSSYEAPSDKKEQKAEKALPLYKALAGVLPATDMPMRVALAPFATPGRSHATLVIALGLQQPVLTADRVVETVELLSTAFNVSHRRAGSYKQTVQMTLRRTPDGGDAKYEVLSKLELAPGRYNTRFAISSVFRGKSGSVFEEIEIPDFRKEPVSMSGVVMAVSPALPAAPRTFLTSVIPVVPTTQRIFLQGHKPTAFLRVYQGGKKPPTAIVLTTTIVDEQDRAVHTANETLEAAHFTGESGVEHRFDLPIDRLAPGAYLLRFEASASGKPVTRDVRFVVR